MVEVFAQELGWVVILPTPTCHVYSEACSTYGSGAFADTLGWFQVKWPEGWKEVDISVKELVPVVIAAAVWGHVS